MKNKRAIAAMWALALIPLALVLFCFSMLPEQVPMQWGVNGSVRYGPRWQLLLMAGLSPLLAALYQFLPKIDPRKKNYETFQRYYDGFAVVLPLFLLAMVCMVLSECFWPGRITVYRVVGPLVGLLFMVVGNMMGKLKSNFFVGIRTPWTLDNPDVWNKTQRLGGLIFFLLGLGAVILPFLLPELAYFCVLLGSIFGGVFLTLFMSWYWYRKDQQTE